MSTAEETTVLSGAAGTGGYRYAVLSPTFFLLAVVVALVSGLAALAGPTSVSAKALCTPPNRAWGNCGSATRQKFRNTVCPAQQEHLTLIGQIQWQATTKTQIAPGSADGATAIPVRHIEILSTFRQLVIYPTHPTANHFGRDPPVQLQLNPWYESNTQYDPAAGFCIAAESTAAQIAAPTGDTYSVAFQTELKTSSYPGILRPAHFQEANENLLQMMESDPQFAQQMQEAGVNMQRTPTGLAPRTSPVGWTWHHAPEPGVLQLVPRWQHTPGSIFWDTLHPGGQGGYAIWGQQ